LETHPSHLLFHPALKRARLVAELKQLYDEGKFADLLAHLAEKMLDANIQKQQEIRGFLGWMQRLRGGKDRRPHAEDEATGLLRARLRELLCGAQEELKEAFHRSCPPGAGRGAENRV